VELRAGAPARAFDRPLTILTGGFGSGKSEFALLWARRLVTGGRVPVTLVDLDRFKPLFRSADAVQEMAAAGVRLVLSASPSGLPSGCLGAARDAGWAVVDVGGDSAGARVLHSLAPRFAQHGFNLLYVLNTRRPGMANVDEAMAELGSLEAHCGLRVTGIVSNTHLLDETDAAMVLDGVEIARRVSSLHGADLLGVMVPEWLADEIARLADIEVYGLRRMLRPPWLRP